MVRQDWGRFKLDAFFPMLYHTFYEAGPEFVKQYTEEAVRTVKAPVHSGLFVGPLDAADFTRTIEMARRRRRRRRVDLRLRRDDGRAMAASAKRPLAS